VLGGRDGRLDAVLKGPPLEATFSALQAPLGPRANDEPSNKVLCIVPATCSSVCVSHVTNWLASAPEAVDAERDNLGRADRHRLQRGRRPSGVKGRGTEGPKDRRT
jgi:hypothetical protein